MVKAGKALYIGASSMFAWQFAKVLDTSDAQRPGALRPMQNHYNLVYREEEREMIPLCLDEGIGVIPWSPLARGFLTGNRRRAGQGRDATARADATTSPTGSTTATTTSTVVDARRPRSRRSTACPNAQVALAWLLAQARRHRADRRRHQAAATSTTRSRR